MSGRLRQVYAAKPRPCRRKDASSNCIDSMQYDARSSTEVGKNKRLKADFTSSCKIEATQALVSAIYLEDADLSEPDCWKRFAIDVKVSSAFANPARRKALNENIACEPCPSWPRFRLQPGMSSLSVLRTAWWLICSMCKTAGAEHCSRRIRLTQPACARARWRAG